MRYTTRAARTLLTRSTVRKFLQLPEEVVITGLYYDFDTDTVGVILTSDALPKRDEGAILPVILPELVGHSNEGLPLMRWPDLV